MFMLMTPIVGTFTPEERAAGALLSEACRRAGVTPKEAAAAMGIDEPMISRWFSGERAVQFPKLLKLPGPALEEFAELFGMEVGVPVITRQAIACFARLLHHRPRPVRARFGVGRKETDRVA